MGYLEDFEVIKAEQAKRFELGKGFVQIFRTFDEIPEPGKPSLSAVKVETPPKENRPFDFTQSEKDYAIEVHEKRSIRNGQPVYGYVIYALHKIDGEIQVIDSYDSNPEI